MKNRVINLLFAVFLLAACSQDVSVPSDPQSGGDGLTTGRTVRLELSLQMASMPGSADGVTRAEVPLSADEAAIRSLQVLQFGGTADGSLLVKKGEVPANDIAEGRFVFDFEELTEGGAMTVYLLANLPATALDGITENATTLGAFKAGNLSVNPLTEEAMKTNGLPMIASQSFDYTTGAPGTFSLKTLLAKVQFRYRTEGFTFSDVSLYASNLADKVPVTEPTAGASVQHPAGIT
ncbi:fimbrial protein, partial [Bacteroides sp.]